VPRRVEWLENNRPGHPEAFEAAAGVYRGVLGSPGGPEQSRARAGSREQVEARPKGREALLRACAAARTPGRILPEPPAQWVATELRARSNSAE